MANAQKKDLVGRKITGFLNPRVWDTERQCWIHPDPRIILDNGRQLYFVTEETESLEYGVFTGITDKPEKV